MQRSKGTKINNFVLIIAAAVFFCYGHEAPQSYFRVGQNYTPQSNIKFSATETATTKDY